MQNRLLHFALLTALVLSSSEVQSENLDEDWDTKQRQGDKALNQSRYDDATVLYETAYRISNKHCQVERSLQQLALAYTKQNKYLLANDTLKRLLLQQEQHLGADHIDLAKTLIEMSRNSIRLNDYATGLSNCKRALAITEKSVGSSNLQTAIILVTLGRYYTIGGHYAQAEKIYRSAISKCRNASDRGMNLSRAQVGLAVCLSDQGRYADAVNLFQQAQTIMGNFDKSWKILITEHERNHAGGDLLSAVALNELAEYYSGLKNYEESVPLYRKALVVCEGLAPESALNALILNNLGRQYLLQGNFAEAEPLFKRSLFIREKPSGQNKIAEATTLENYSVLLANTGNQSQADILAEKAAQLRKNNH